MKYACASTVEVPCAIFVNITVLHNLSQMSALISHSRKYIMCQPEAQKFPHETLSLQLLCNNSSLQAWASAIPNRSLGSVCCRIKLHVFLISKTLSGLVQIDMWLRHIFVLCRTFPFDFHESCNSYDLYKFLKCRYFLPPYHLWGHNIKGFHTLPYITTPP